MEDLETRKNWFSPIADLYDQARPRYPQALIRHTINTTQLSPQSNLLEIGCGSGIATVAFAPLGCSIVGLEPSEPLYQLACDRCKPYPNVRLLNTSFEEWNLEPDNFDAVLAANAFHWIPSEIAHVKSAAALRDRGFLILLWNMTPEPQHDVYQLLNEVYQEFAPSLSRYEGPRTQEEILRGFMRDTIDSGLFTHFASEQLSSETTYSVDDYLMLLSTFSQYRRLESPIREALFAGLRETIKTQLGGQIQLSYLSAVHIAQKR